jgi:hypothetical protein
MLMWGSYDTAVRLWDLNTLRCVRKCEGHRAAVHMIRMLLGRNRKERCQEEMEKEARGVKKVKRKWKL